MTRFSIALCLLCAGLAQASPLPDYPFVSASGKAQTWLKPDIGELQFTTTAENTRTEVAAARLDETSAGVLRMLAEHGVPDADIESFDLAKKTVELSNPASDGATRAYLMERHFRVQVRDLEQWPQIVAALMAQEHLEALSVAFDRSDRDRIDSKLMAEAAEDARGKGAALATAFGRHLGAVVAIARGPLDKLGAPFGLDSAAPATVAVARAPDGPKYAVPGAIPFAQAVNAIFKLR